MAAEKKATTTKKPAAKKPAAKKPAAKKPAAKKPAAKKPAAKKPATKSTNFHPDVVGRTAKENLEGAAAAIDSQMKKIASMDTRFLIAMDQLNEFQDKVQERWTEFQEENTKKARDAWESAKNKLADHRSDMDDIKQKREEATKSLNDHKTLHETYESIVESLENGRKKAVEEAKKVEVSFMKQLHKIEEQMLRKAEQIKKKYRDDD